MIFHLTSFQVIARLDQLKAWGVQQLIWRNQCQRNIGLSLNLWQNQCERSIGLSLDIPSLVLITSVQYDVLHVPNSATDNPSTFNSVYMYCFVSWWNVIEIFLIKCYWNILDEMLLKYSMYFHLYVTDCNKATETIILLQIYRSPYIGRYVPSRFLQESWKRLRADSRGENLSETQRLRRGGVLLTTSIVNFH